MNQTDHTGRISLERLTQEPYVRILCYPHPTKSELQKRLKQLQRLGVIAIEFEGKKEIAGVHVLGKGCVGIVTLAYVGTQRVALKIRRTDADRSTMLHEAKMLARSNSVNVGPELYGCAKDFMLTEFIDGQLLPEWLGRRKGKNVVRSVLRLLLEQCRELDRISLDHGELSHAPKHVIITGSGLPRIVDFETASINRRPSNVTCICQYLFVTGPVADRISKLLGKTDRDVVLSSLRDYKKTRKEACFEDVLDALGL